MRIPVIRGVIDRRILANFRIDADVMAKNLPAPFRPKLVNGSAIGGICLIRLRAIRPRFLPIPWGIGSENAAHRVAVEWDADGRTHEGVYVIRRDTNSRLNSWAGGTVFPGLHHHAVFNVNERDGHFSVAFESVDRTAHAYVSGAIATQFPESSLFETVADASRFFEAGSLGYSLTRTNGRYEGLELRCKNWSVEPLTIDRIESSYFQDTSRFPAASVAFDNALVMRHIEHEWHSREDLCCPASSGLQ